MAEQHTSITNSNRWTSIIYNKINCLHSALGRPRFRFGLVVMELKSLMTAEVPPLACFPAYREVAEAGASFVCLHACG